MKRIFLIISLFTYIAMTPVMAQIGAPYIHDPSTIAEADGNTTPSAQVAEVSSLMTTELHKARAPWWWCCSRDMLKHRRPLFVSTVLQVADLAVDTLAVSLLCGIRLLILSRQDQMEWRPLRYVPPDGMEDQDAIDPGLLLDPTTGRLWVSYGFYFGTIRLIELDPKTGFRKKGNKEKDIAIDCEGLRPDVPRWMRYYLLGTHGTMLRRG